MVPVTLPLIWKAKHYPPLYTLSYKTGDKIRVTFLLIILLNLMNIPLILYVYLRADLLY